MEHDAAVRLLRPAVPARGGAWADLGAGRGTFTAALADLLGSAGRVFALDRDRAAVAALRDLAGRRHEHRAEIRPVEGDFRRLDGVPELDGVRLDGALFANALHFVDSPGDVLSDVAGRLRDGGAVAVIEYEGRSPSPWVPHPLPPDRLERAARAAGIGRPRIVGRHPSRYRGSMYCALLETPGSAAG